MFDTMTTDDRPTIWVEESDPATEPAERFTIDSQDKAEWVLRKGAALEAEITLLKAQYRARLAELEADKAAWERRFLAELKAWGEVEKERRRRQTVTTLAGTLAFRMAPARLVVADLDAAIKHAERWCPDALSFQVELDGDAYRDAAKRLLDTTGELLPGIERTEPQEAFAIRFPKGEKGKGGEEE